MKKASEFDLPSTELVFVRFLFQGFFVVLYMCRFHADLEDIPPKNDDSPSVLAPTTHGRENGPQNHNLCHPSSQSTHVENKKDTSTDGNKSKEEILKIAGDLLITIPFGRSQNEKSLVIVSGLIWGFIVTVCYFYSLEVLPVGDAVIINSLYPIFTIFLAGLFLGEEITFRKQMIALIGIVGAILISSPSFLTGSLVNDLATSTRTTAHFHQKNSLGYIIGLIGGIAFSFELIILKKAGDMGINVLNIMFSNCFFGIFSTLFLHITVGRSMLNEMWFLPKEPEALLYIIGLCACNMGAGALITYSAQFAPAGLSSIVLSTDILWSYLLEVVVFHQVPSLTTIIGVILILSMSMVIAAEKIDGDYARQFMKCKKVTCRTGVDEESIPLLSGGDEECTMC